MTDCIFCKIAKRKAPATIIKSTKEAIAILDINPDKEGHTLIIPKKHHDDIATVDPKTLKEMVFLAQWVVQKLRTKFGQEDIHIESWNGGAVQNPRHFHIHVCAEYGPSVPEANKEYFDSTKKKFKS